MLEIQDISGKTKEEIKDLILENFSDPFEFYLPKSTQEFFSEREAIAMDYLYLAFGGQLLSEVVKDFEYDEVSPGLHQSVEFNFKIENLDELVDAIFKISFGYVNSPEDSDYFDENGYDFLEESLEFADKVEKGTIKAVCPYFFKTYHEFLQDDEE